MSRAAVRRAGGEECFCADASGVATGTGLFRTSFGDLSISYREGVRDVGMAGRFFNAVNSDGVFAGAVLVALLLTSLLRCRTALRAWAVMAVSLSGGLATVPLATVALGIPLSFVMNAGYGAWGVMLSAGVFAGLGVLGVSSGFLTSRLRASRLTVSMMYGAVLLALLLFVGLRLTALGQSYASVSEAPGVVQRESP
jgi:hypothetical protein